MRVTAVYVTASHCSWTLFEGISPYFQLIMIQDLCVALKLGSPFQIHYLADLNGNLVLVFKVSDQKSNISECPNEIQLNFNANDCGYMMVAKSDRI